MEINIELNEKRPLIKKTLSNLAGRISMPWAINPRAVYADKLSKLAKELPNHIKGIEKATEFFDNHNGNYGVIIKGNFNVREAYTFLINSGYFIIGTYHRQPRQLVSINNEGDSTMEKYK